MSDTLNTQAPNRRPALPGNSRQTDYNLAQLNARQATRSDSRNLRFVSQGYAALHRGVTTCEARASDACAAVERLCIDRGDGAEDATCGLMPFGRTWSTFTRFAGACAEGVAS